MNIPSHSLRREIAFLRAFSPNLHSIMSKGVLNCLTRLALTEHAGALMLCPLSAQLKGGRGNPNTQGFNKPLSHAVFLCHSKIKAVSNRLHSVMAGLLGNSKELPFLGTVFPPLFSPAANVVENISSGLHPHKPRNTAMNTSTGEIRQKSNYQTTYEAALHQAKIEDSLNLVLKELGNIEKLSSRAVNDNSFTGFFSSLCDIFQHSQRALNAAHDLKNANQQA